MTIEIFHLTVQNHSDGIFYNSPAEEFYRSITLNRNINVAAQIYQKPEEGICYVKVAEIDDNDLDQAFELTNHIDDSWTKNIGVKFITSINYPKGPRSTSVGDIMRIDGEKAMLVDSFGFTELPIVNDSELTKHSLSLRERG